MKYLIILLNVFIFSLKGFSQSIILGSFLSGMSSLEPKEISLDYSVGAPFLFSNDNTPTMTMGIHQPGKIQKEHKTQSELKIFPNPVHDNLNLEFDAAHENILVQIYNLDGKVVLEEFFSSGLKLNLNCNFLNPGLYCIKVIENGNSRYRNQKLVKF